MTALAGVPRLRRTELAELLSPGGAGASWLLSGGVGLAAFAVYFVRSLPLANKLWAEDASVYLTNAYNHPWGGIVKPYNGYLDLAPGILELPLRLVSPRDAPLAIIVTTGVVYGLVAVLTTRVASLYLRSAALAVVLGLATVLEPILGQEAIAELGAIQFVLVFALFWLVLLPTRGVSVWAVAGVLLIALTSPLALAAIPLALFLAWLSRPKRALVAALVVGGVVEGAIHLSGAGGQRGATGESAAGAGLRGLERLFASLAPNQLAGSAASRAGVSLVVLLLLVLTLGALIGRGGKMRPALGLGVLAFVSCVWFELFAAVANHGSADRYLVPSSLFLIVALVAAADEIAAAPPPRARVALLSCASICILALAAVAGDWRPGTWRSSSLPWDAQVTKAMHRCAASPRRDVVGIPAGAFPWAVAEVPCSRL
ncbi:MAG TPA: hypothetical protein VFA37_02575 [Gaiellaceae bacterium]|nr:hypothetical protein [Gaiellaceae bacterium]